MDFVGAQLQHPGHPKSPPPCLPACTRPPLQVSKSGSTVQFVPNLDGAPSATVVQADIQACQAVIHKVGRVGSGFVAGVSSRQPGRAQLRHLRQQRALPPCAESALWLVRIQRVRLLHF